MLEGQRALLFFALKWWPNVRTGIRDGNDKYESEDRQTGEKRAISSRASEIMLNMLEAQEFNSHITPLEIARYLGPL